MCYVGELQKCLLENPDGDNSDDDDEDDNIHGEMICELIKPGQIIALHTPPEDKHSFYLVSVNEVKTAENDLFDAFQHFALRGEKYLSCNYLEIISEENKIICYKKCTSQVVVLPGEVLSPFLKT